MKHALLTVLGKDRPGIIASVTGILYQRGCNLEDISMTILEGEFSMMMILSFSQEKESGIRAELEKMSHQARLSYFWHALKSKPKRGARHARNAQPVLITALGKDRTGIVYKISQILADFQINITDLKSQILGQKNDTVYTMLLEADLPRHGDVISDLTLALRKLANKLKIEINLKPVEHIEI